MSADRPGPSWWSFMALLLALCAVLAVTIYRAEQRGLTKVRDECVAEATTDSERAECLREYERNSAWM